MRVVLALLLSAATRAYTGPRPTVPVALSRRGFLGGAAAATLAQPAQAVVYFDPARYGDQELKNAAIAKCRTRVRDAVVQDPSYAARFFLLAILDGLSYDERSRRGGPDATVAASIQVPGPEYADLREALDVLQESQKALKRTNALTLADLVALAGAEAVAAVGGPEISVQLGRTDAPDILEKTKAVKTGGWKAAQELNIAPAFDVAAARRGDATDSVLKAFKRSGFSEREATALLGTLGTLETFTADTTAVDDRGSSKARGKIGRSATPALAQKKRSQPLIDLYGTAEGDEEASVDKMEGDLDEFYIADAFGTRRDAYGKRAASASEATFNQYFADLGEDGASSSWVDAALLGDPNTKVWVNKYGAERLTYLKDLDKTFYRITQVGAAYTGGKYAALLDNKPEKKLS